MRPRHRWHDAVLKASGSLSAPSVLVLNMRRLALVLEHGQSKPAGPEDYSKAERKAAEYNIGPNCALPSSFLG